MFPSQLITTEGQTSELPSWESELNETRMLNIIKDISADDFEGRHVGTNGDKLIQGYLNSELENIGLQKIINETDFRQAFISSGYGSTANLLAGISAGPNIQSEQVIIISAHMDHLGIASPGRVFNGANDDASGVAVVLEVARLCKLLSIDYSFKKNIIFAFWNAEEVGFQGSKYFVSSEPLKKYNLEIELVINLDEVGYDAGDHTLWVSGGLDIPEIYANGFETAAEKVGILNTNLYKSNGGSDHQSFLDKNIPAMTLVWTAHRPFWHTTDDTWEKIDTNLLGKTTSLLMTLLIDQYGVLDTSKPLENSRDLDPIFVITKNENKSNYGLILGGISIGIMILGIIFLLRYSKKAF